VTAARFHSLFDGCLDIDPTQAAADLVRTLPSGKGILLFADSSDRPIQLLLSASVRAAAAARLAPQAGPATTRKADPSAVIARIYHLRTFCDFRSTLRYRQVAMELYPNEYRSMMNLGRLSLVRIDLSAPWPYFAVTQRAAPSPDARVYGPFPSHKSAIAMAQALNHAFLLCREPSLAIEPEKARSCSYLQMGTCPAPCVGRSPRADYLKRVESAMQAAAGQRQSAIADLTQHMRSLADERRFEEANHVKLSLQSLQILTERTYDWTTELSRLAVLHVDRSGRVAAQGSRKLAQSYAAFVIRPGRIDEMEDFTMPQLAARMADLPHVLTEPCPAAEPMFADSLAMLESFLYRSTPPGIFVELSRPPTVEGIALQLEKRFARPEATG